MSHPEMRPDPSGTVYSARRTPRLRLPEDPLMRIALGVALVGVLLGAAFAMLAGGDEPVRPATAAPAPTADEPSAAPTSAPTSAAAPTSAPAPTTPAAPSPTTPPLPAGGPTVLRGVASGRCVGVTDDDPEGANAQLADCTGGPAQQWVATPVGSGVFTLVNAASGKCLDVDGQSTDDGVDVQQWSCNGQANQQWQLTPIGSGQVVLVAVHSGKCAQVADAGTEAGSRLTQAPCSGAPEQQWAVG